MSRSFWDEARVDDALIDAAEWQVVVEETVGFMRERQRWELTRIFPQPDRDTARRFAAELAERYQPEHPTKPRHRRVIKVGLSQWIVQVPGLTQDFHFRVSVGRLVSSEAY